MAKKTATAKKTTTAAKTTIKKTTATSKVAKKATVKAAASKSTAVPATKTTTSASTTAVDKECPLASSAKVHETFDAMLNQTNIGANNNKFYIVQLVVSGAKYYVWTRWGRVGESGQNALLGPYTLEAAIDEFEKKFKSKTSNNWQDRGKFQSKAGKYTLIEIDRSADEARAAEVESKLKALDGKAPKAVPKIQPSKLDAPLQSLIQLIFNKDMFRSAMADLEIDVNKMPLGQLSESQVKLGFGVLVEIAEQLEKSRTNASKLAELSSRFYTVIPHSFGRRVPPVIGDSASLQKKMDMLNVLSDIEVALAAESKAQAKTSIENPLDKNYASLKADLTPVKPTTPEYQVIEKYLSATRGQAKSQIVDVFRLGRQGEHERFDQHAKIDNRKLLWHGTNVAVVAAILKGGLRIMPHSGGRVGRGIYMASEHGKSAWYVGRSGNTGIMFLAEAALGKEHSILRDDSRLKSPPKGFHSIVARGVTEPDPKLDTTITLDGKTIVVPQGPPIKQKDYSKSNFSQSEYLVYQESQVRLRYLLKLKM